jgi:multidrug efflux pump subunit AcrA (membrane-fusion protein)
MNDKLDLKQLAVDRKPDAEVLRPRSHMLTRYVIPGTLAAGFLVAVLWALRGILLPGTPVTVIPVHVSKAQLQQAGTPLFKAAGWAEPRPTPIRVPALAPGVVRELLVVDDQLVKAGDPIVTLIDDDARLMAGTAMATVALQAALVEQAKAAATAANENFERPLALQATLARVTAEYARIVTSLLDLPFQRERAEARLELARLDFEGKTLSGSVVSRIALDGAAREQRSAKALVDELKRRQQSLQVQADALGRQKAAVQQQLDLKIDQTRQRDEAAAQLEAARARLTQAQISQAEAELRLERMTVRAPVDGRVLHLLASPGTHLSGGTGRMGEHDGGVAVTLYQPAMLQVRVDVRFEDLPSVTGGQQVLIEGSALTEPLMGEVLYLTSEADVQKNTLEVKVAIHGAPELVKPEMLVDVTFLAVDSAGAAAGNTESISIYVPRQHLREGDSGPYVWAVAADGAHARRVQVETSGPGNSSLVLITSGLTASSRIIVSPTEGLQDGDRVTVEEAAVND